MCVYERKRETETEIDRQTMVYVRGQRTIYRNWFLSYPVRLNLVIRLSSKHLYLTSHLVGPQLFFTVNYLQRARDSKEFDTLIIASFLD